MSLDDPSLDPLKWGPTTLGTGSGQIGWAMDLSGLETASGYSIADYENEVVEAFERWEDVSDVDFGMVDVSDADVVFQVGSLDAGAGLASISFVNRGDVDQILSGTITMDADRTWTPEGQPGGSDFFAVALHEVGHVLGLAHIDDSSQIMNATIRVDDLGDLDIDAVQELYGDADVPDSGDAIAFDDEGTDETSESGDTSEVEASAEDGGGGGGIALVFGLLAAVLAFIFGGGSGGAAAVAIAAGDVDDDPDDLPELDEDGLPPEIMVHEHPVFLAEDGIPHGYGCDCACCSESIDDFA